MEKDSTRNRRPAPGNRSSQGRPARAAQDRSPQNRAPRDSGQGSRPRRRRRRSSKARRRRARRIRAIAILIAIVVAIILVIVLLVKNITVVEPAPDQTTLNLRSDGTIVYDEVTVLPEEYDAQGLKEFAQEQADAYNPPEEQLVEVQRVEISEEKVFVRMEYASAHVYSDFTGYPAFDGSISQALAAGYNFETGFVDAATGSSISRDAVIANRSNRVFIIQEGTRVRIEGNILYVSSEGTNVSEASEGYVTVSSPDGSQDAAPVCYIVYEQPEET